MPAAAPLALVMSGHCLDAHHRGLKRRRRKNDIKSPIKTVVVVENRGIFDHVLGWLPRTRLDIDGLTGREYNRLNASDPSSPEIFITGEAGYVDSDPDHDFEDIWEQIFGSADTSVVPTPTSGFAKYACGMGLGMLENVMSGFKPDAIPIYACLADESAYKA